MCTLNNVRPNLLIGLKSSPFPPCPRTHQWPKTRSSELSLTKETPSTGLQFWKNDGAALILFSTSDSSLVCSFHSWLARCASAAMQHSSLQATWRKSSDVSRGDARTAAHILSHPHLPRPAVVHLSLLTPSLALNQSELLPKSGPKKLLH